MLPWIIGIAATAAIGAIGKAIFSEDSGSSNSSSSNSSYLSDTEARQEEIKLERSILEQSEWNKFKSKAESSFIKLSEKAEEDGLGKLVKTPYYEYMINNKSDFMVLTRNQNKDFFEFVSFDKSLSDDDTLDGLNTRVSAVNNLISGEVDSLLWDSSALVSSKIFFEYKDIMKDFVPKEKLDKIEAFILESSEHRPRLAVAGILKAGKSTLMNRLTGDFHDQRFAIDVIRATKHEKVFEQDGIFFVDTPGIDADDTDTKVAIASLITADIILFVHNIRNGGLDEPERQFLRELSNNYESNEEFLAKSIFVITHMENMQKQFSTVRDEITEQIKLIFDGEPTIVPVASETYRKGVLENKPLLVERSNFSELQRIINEKKLIAIKTKKSSNERKIDMEARQIREELLIQKYELIKKITEIKNSYTEQYVKFSELLQKENQKLYKAFVNYKRKMERFDERYQ